MENQLPRNTPKRLNLSGLGEYYWDLITIDSWINNRSPGTQAVSLLCAKLQERVPKIEKRVEYMARKRGITPEEMWDSILSGTAERLFPGDATDDDSD